MSVFMFAEPFTFDTSYRSHCMKHLWALFLITIIMVKPLYPLLEYGIHYDYIVTHLCENKDRPQLQCNGKCYLAQMFAAQSADHQENPFAEERPPDAPCILMAPMGTTMDNDSHEWNNAQVASDYNTILHNFLFVFKRVQPPEARLPSL